MNSEIKNILSELRKQKSLFALLFFLLIAFFSQSVYSQSSDVNFPTPIITNEITGTISARAVGDSRLTRFFYKFNGTQGDIFINVKTNNLDGDIDVFTVKELDSLTKITIYSDSSENETGRVIYLRKPETLILRIEARSPNDNPATFTIKFAGSFAPLPITSENLRVSKPKVKGANQGAVKVNAIGTIIETPKPVSAAKTESAAITKEAQEKSEIKTEKTASITAEIPQIFDPTKKKENESEDFTVENKTETEVSVSAEKTETEIDPVSAENEIADDTENSVVEGKTETNEIADTNEETEIPAETVSSKPTEIAEEKTVSNEKTETVNAIENAKTTELSSGEKSFDPSQLANVRLKISLKNGEKIEHPMSEVVWFNVNQGVLTVITNGGKIEKYQILDVAKMSIE